MFIALFYVLLLVFFDQVFSQLVSAGTRKFYLERAYQCPDASAPFFVTPKSITNDGIQEIEANCTVPFNLDENTLVKLSMNVPASDGKWMTVFKLEDKRGVCSFFNHYLRDMWFEIQRDVGMVPKQCPILKVS